MSLMPIRRLSAGLSLLVALMVSGCIRDVASVSGPGTKASGGTGADIAGTYILRTVNGQSLPYTYRTEGADTYVLLDDAVTMTTAGQWNEVLRRRRYLRDHRHPDRRHDRQRQLGDGVLRGHLLERHADPAWPVVVGRTRRNDDLHQVGAH